MDAHNSVGGLALFVAKILRRKSQAAPALHRISADGNAAFLAFTILVEHRPAKYQSREDDMPTRGWTLGVTAASWSDPLDLKPIEK